MTIPEAALLMTPQPIHDVSTDRCLAISNEGRMLIFPIRDLPKLGKGKGNKIIGIPKPSFESGEDFLQEVITLREGEELKLISGKRYFSIKYKDLENFLGNRGRRGNFLPKGFRKVDRVEVTRLNTQKE